jgi:hypothetical protein
VPVQIAGKVHKSHGVDGLSALADEEVAAPERHLTGLALNRHNRHEPHGRLRHRFTNRRGVGRIGRLRISQS